MTAERKPPGFGQVAVERDGDTVTVTLSSLGTYEAMRIYDDLIRQVRETGVLRLTIPTRGRQE